MIRSVTLEEGMEGSTHLDNGSFRVLAVREQNQLPFIL